MLSGSAPSVSTTIAEIRDGDGRTRTTHRRRVDGVVERGAARRQSASRLPQRARATSADRRGGTRDWTVLNGNKRNVVAIAEQLRELLAPSRAAPIIPASFMLPDTSMTRHDRAFLVLLPETSDGIHDFDSRHFECGLRLPRIDAVRGIDRRSAELHASAGRKPKVNALLLLRTGEKEIEIALRAASRCSGVTHSRSTTPAG